MTSLEARTHHRPPDVGVFCQVSSAGASLFSAERTRACANLRWLSSRPRSSGSASAGKQLADRGGQGRRMAHAAVDAYPETTGRKRCGERLIWACATTCLSTALPLMRRSLRAASELGVRHWRAERSADGTGWYARRDSSRDGGEGGRGEGRPAGRLPLQRHARQTRPRAARVGRCKAVLGREQGLTLLARNSP